MPNILNTNFNEDIIGEKQNSTLVERSFRQGYNL